MRKIPMSYFKNDNTHVIDNENRIKSCDLVNLFSTPSSLRHQYMKDTSSLECENETLNKQIMSKTETLKAS